MPLISRRRPPPCCGSLLQFSFSALPSRSQLAVCCHRQTAICLSSLQTQPTSRHGHSIVRQLLISSFDNLSLALSPSLWQLLLSAEKPPSLWLLFDYLSTPLENDASRALKKTRIPFSPAELPHQKFQPFLSHCASTRVHAPFAGEARLHHGVESLYGVSNGQK